MHGIVGAEASPVEGGSTGEVHAVYLGESLPNSGVRRRLRHLARRWVPVSRRRQHGCWQLHELPGPHPLRIRKQPPRPAAADGDQTNNGAHGQLLGIQWELHWQEEPCRCRWQLLRPRRRQEPDDDDVGWRWSAGQELWYRRRWPAPPNGTGIDNDDGGRRRRCHGSYHVHVRRLLGQ